MTTYRILEGDCTEQLRTLPEQSVQTCVTSPPYWGLRDYGEDGQLGLEPTPEEYVANLVAVFAEVRRVLRDDGTVWLNLGDSYAAGKAGRTDHGTDDPTSRLGPLREGLPNGAQPGPVVPRKAPPGLKPKDLCGIPWLVAFALRADGWYLRSEIIWAKPNPMPESVTDRPTRAHEQIFLLSKKPRYFYDADAVREEVSPNSTFTEFTHETPYAAASGKAKGLGNGSRGDPAGRNKRTVWTVTTQPFPGAHFATFPPDLIEPCILAGAAEGDTVLDPFSGAGTTGIVALRHDRDYIGIELNPEYAQMSRDRIYQDGPLLNVEAV